MRPEQIAALAGLILSLALAYVPRLREWYDALDAQGKVAVLGALLVVAAGALAVRQCGVVGQCYAANWDTFLSALVAALISSQASYQIFVRPFPGRITRPPEPDDPAAGRGIVRRPPEADVPRDQFGGLG